MNSDKHSKGQYFTTSPALQAKVVEFIKNKPDLILEPSMGRGHLVEAVRKAFPTAMFNAWEIDSVVELLPSLRDFHDLNIKREDFLLATIDKKYKTIIGNPPFVKRSGLVNLYLEFIRKCVGLLAEDGELIFVVPSDFFKMTSSASLIQEMLDKGTLSHVFYPNDETLFKNASIDVLVFRYQLGSSDPKTFYNNEVKFLQNQLGLITFSDEPLVRRLQICDRFDVFVGIVSGMDSVFKNPIGNIDIMANLDTVEKFILIAEYPSGNPAIDEYLLEHKPALMNRKIRKFDETNWYQWGALRNLGLLKDHLGKPCIYVSTMSRKPQIAKLGKVGPFGGSLLLMLPRGDFTDEILRSTVEYLNGEFRTKNTYSGRFKITQRNLSYALMP